MARGDCEAQSRMIGMSVVKSQVELKLSFPDFFSPRREQRHQKVYSAQHIDEPQMSGRIVEVQEQVLEIGHRLSESESILLLSDKTQIAQ